MWVQCSTRRLSQCSVSRLTFLQLLLHNTRGQQWSRSGLQGPYISTAAPVRWGMPRDNSAVFISGFGLCTLHFHRIKALWAGSCISSIALYLQFSCIHMQDSSTKQITGPAYLFFFFFFTDNAKSVKPNCLGVRMHWDCLGYLGERNILN